MECGMKVTIKNTFLQVEDAYNERSSDISRRCRSVPREWKPIPTFSNDYASDVSTECYTPRSRGSTVSSLEEGLPIFAHCFGIEHDASAEMPDPLDARSIAASDSMKAQRHSLDSAIGFCSRSCCSQQNEVARDRGKFMRSSQPGFKACSRKDSSMDALITAIHAALTTRLPTHCVNIEKAITEESCRSFVLAEVPSNSFAPSHCYDIMQSARQALTNMVSRLDAAVLLSARLQREDIGYSLRSSVACVHESAREKMCWNVLRHGSCRNKCCKWYHPQTADIIKLKIVVRRQDALNANSKVLSIIRAAP